jgi:Coenzyme PQQ synthesis protein D (PqqD)
LRYCVNTSQVINEVIDGEAIMINLATGSYYSLDRVGAEVWALVETSMSVDGIVAALGRRYDAAPDDIRRGVEDLLQHLSSEQLVVPCLDEKAASAADAAATPETATGPRQPFQPPRLEKFTDMQDLILLDPVHEVDSRGWPHLPDEHSATR